MLAKIQKDRGGFKKQSNMYTCYIELNIILSSTKQCILKGVFDIRLLWMLVTKHLHGYGDIENGE